MRADVIAFVFEQAAPTEIACEIFRGHAVHPAHPGFQAAVVGVDVLNMMPRLPETSGQLPPAGCYAHEIMPVGGHETLKEAERYTSREWGTARNPG